MATLHERLRSRTPGLGDAQPEPAATIPDDPRPDGADRYAIYALRDGERRRLCETNLAGLGLAIQTMGDEEEADWQHDRLGILDREERVWLVNPWAKG